MTSSVQLLTLIPGENLKAGIQGLNRLVQMARSCPVENWEIRSRAKKMENLEPIWTDWTEYWTRDLWNASVFWLGYGPGISILKIEIFGLVQKNLKLD